MQGYLIVHNDPFATILLLATHNIDRNLHGLFQYVDKLEKELIKCIRNKVRKHELFNAQRRYVYTKRKRLRYIVANLLL